MANIFFFDKKERSMYKTTTCSVSGILAELMGFVTEGGEGPFVLTIYDQIYNPNDAFGLKNALELFSEVDIRVALMAGNTSGALIVAAAVPKEKRYITENGVFAFSKPEYHGHGDFKTLKIAADAQRDIEERMDKILDEAYDLPEKSADMHKESRTPRAQEVINYGFKPFKELLQ